MINDVQTMEESRLEIAAPGPAVDLNGPSHGPRIAFGPDQAVPSWDWVGFDLSRELSKYYPITFFSRRSKEPPPCDLMVMIKRKPINKFLQNLWAAGTKVLYCPIDNYGSLEQIEADADFLRRCEAILVHCERLVPIFQRFCPRVEFVEHHNRFGLARPAEYRMNGYAVWIGGLEYLGRAVEWLQRYPLGMEIKFVTNFSRAWKDRLRDALPIEDPHEVIRWSPNSQRDVMAGARAAFDIKGDDFGQMHKPPVKAQKFVCSGIPFAINPGSYSSEYFEARGFKMASPLQRIYWLSRDYWESTRQFGRELSAQLTLEMVGAHYRRIIDRTLAGTW